MKFLSHCRNGINVLVLSGLLLFSCSDGLESVEEATTGSVDKKLVEEVLSLPRPIITLGYDKLNSGEKVLFWNMHINKFMRDHDLSGDLKKHIVRLRDFNTLELQNSLDSPETRDRIKKFEAKWFFEPLSQKRFSREILLMASTLAGAGIEDVTLSTLNRTTRAVSSEVSNCDCNYSLGCIGWSASCSTTTCDVQGSNHNCGIFGSSSCTGKCSVPG